jgi:hypothetical protein
VGEPVKVATALLTLTAAIWLYAAESQVHLVTDDASDGIYLTDSRTAGFIMSTPEKLGEVTAFVKKYETGIYEDIVRHLNLAPALREGDL